MANDEDLMSSAERVVKVPRGYKAAPHGHSVLVAARGEAPAVAVV
jgi:hypothetical protein